MSMPMQRINESEQTGFAERYRRQANLVAAIAAAFATFAEVTLFRRHFGSRYFQGFRTFGAFLLIPLFSVFWQGYDLRLLYGFWLLYMFRCAFHRFEIARAERRIANVIGVQPVHSYYNGVPVLLRRYPRMGEVTVKCKLEPAVMLGMGLASLLISPPVGWFFIWCAAGMAVNSALLERHAKQQALDMADAAIESELLAERMRELLKHTMRAQRRRP